MCYLSENKAPMPSSMDIRDKSPIHQESVLTIYGFPLVIRLIKGYEGKWKPRVTIYFD